MVKIIIGTQGERSPEEEDRLKREVADFRGIHEAQVLVLPFVLSVTELEVPEREAWEG
jgi:hypothetical protein